jgi:isocitrate dehydrogenase
MTKDLAVNIHGNDVVHDKHYVYTEEYLNAVEATLRKNLMVTA